MKKIKNKKGITLVALVITVVILLILSGIVISKVNMSATNSTYNKMVADVKLLEEKILVYYNKYQTVPGIEITDTSNFPTIAENGKNIPKGEGEKYYKIDLSQLSGISLNYGKHKEETDKDYYIVNDTTLKVYYMAGITIDSGTYYTNPDF